MKTQKISIARIQHKKTVGEKITMLTAYDYPTARIIDEAGIDMILVGDSLAMVVLGYDSTSAVSMDEMIHHAKAAGRATKKAFLVGDMPFMSYQSSIASARKNAGRFVKEAGCDAVKIEGGGEIAKTAKAIVQIGIPVIGHVGLTPQTATKLGGFKVQGRTKKHAERILAEAVSLERAGCMAIILECIPTALAKKITKTLKIPTIGIGAGADCDGQVLVTHDLLGLYDKFTPRFVKQYANASKIMRKAFREYKSDVKRGKFPTARFSFKA